MTVGITIKKQCMEIVDEQVEHFGLGQCEFLTGIHRTSISRFRNGNENWTLEKLQRFMKGMSLNMYLVNKQL